MQALAAVKLGRFAINRRGTASGPSPGTHAGVSPCDRQVAARPVRLVGHALCGIPLRGRNATEGVPYKTVAWTAQPSMIPSCRDASIDWKHDSRDPTGSLIVGQEEDGLGNVPRLAVPPQRVKRVERIHLLGA